MEKYKKRLQRMEKISNKSHQVEDTPRTKTRKAGARFLERFRKTLLYHNAIVYTIKGSLKESTVEKSGKEIQRVRIHSRSLAKKYKMQPWLKSVFGKYWTSLDPKSHTVNRKPKESVISFYEQDDVSRITAGKGETITRNKVKKQKRFLLDSMSNLHLKFMSLNPNTKISYQWFCKLRPFQVLVPTIDSRDTCLCKICDNYSLLIKKLVSEKVIRNALLVEFVAKISCRSWFGKQVEKGVCIQ